MTAILYWIDDAHDMNLKTPQGVTRENLMRDLNVDIQVKIVDNRDEFGDILSQVDAANTRGVIMDYQLTRVGKQSQMEYGTTWAAEIRASHPSIPVIGISHTSEDRIPKFRIENFLAFFQRDPLLSHTPPVHCLNALLDGYQKVWTAYKADGVQFLPDLIKLIDPPEDSAGVLYASLPAEIRDAWDDETPHVVGRWIWHEFQGLPGQLFDELELLTYLGLSPEAGTLIVPVFEPVRYRGVFASDGRRRWWVSLMRDYLSSVIGHPCVGSVSNYRIELLEKLGIPRDQQERFLSTPYSRPDSAEIPDCVAYIDESKSEIDRAQCIFMDTEIDARDANPAFGFQARRVFKGVTTE